MKYRQMKTTIFLAAIFMTTSCSNVLSYDDRMKSLVSETGPGNLPGAEKAFAYCAEELKKDRVVPKSLYLGSCSGLEIMIIQNTIEGGDPQKIKEKFDETQIIHSDFGKWRPMYVLMAKPFVQEFCNKSHGIENCLSILK